VGGTGGEAQGVKGNWGIPKDPKCGKEDFLVSRDSFEEYDNK
jgi:hypothetical protein